RHTRSKRDWSSDVCSSDLTISITESGNMDGFKGKTPANFVAYQSMVSKSLDNLSKEEGWIRINVANYTEEEVTKKVLNSLTVKMKGIYYGDWTKYKKNMGW